MPGDMPVMFHTGMIVNDLETSMRQFSAAFGFTWAEPQRVVADLRGPKGIKRREAVGTYSLEGPHHIELVQQIDAAVWHDVTGGPLVHHIGFWVDDLAGEVARLEALGFRPEVSGVAADGGPGDFVYIHNHLGGLWLELVDSAMRPGVERWLHGSELNWRQVAD